MCVTIYIFNTKGTHTLLMNHRKLQKWVPSGGKVDPNEIPDHAAVREAKEETGLDICLLGETAPVTGGLIRPFATQLNEITPGEKEHIDLIYVAIPRGEATLKNNIRESEEIKWFSIEEVLNQRLNTFPSVRIWVEKFSQEIRNKTI